MHSALLRRLTLAIQSLRASRLSRPARRTRGHYPHPNLCNHPDHSDRVDYADHALSSDHAARPLRTRTVHAVAPLMLCLLVGCAHQTGPHKLEIDRSVSAVNYSSRVQFVVL